MTKKSLALTAAAVVAGVMALSGAGTANAARPIFIPRMHHPMMHAPMMHDPMMHSPMMGSMHTFHNSGNNWCWRCRHHRHDRDFAFLAFGFPYYDGYYDDYYYPSYSYGYGESHVQWCLAHYRTYDPRTNTFIGIDGYRHRCVGPYY